MVDKDTLVTKYIYNTSGTNNARLYVYDKNDNTGEFICYNKDNDRVLLSYDTVFKDYTSISPIYVLSVKKCDDKVGLVINKYLSESEDPENGYKYTHGMEIDIEEAIKNRYTEYKPNWMMYNRIDIDKSPKYKNAKTLKVVYGYYTSSLNELLISLSYYVLGYKLRADILQVKKYLKEYIRKVFGVQYVYPVIVDNIQHFIEGKYRSVNSEVASLCNIFNIPLNFNLIDRSSIQLLQYDLTLDLEKFKNYYSPYNTVILKTLEGRVYVMGFHNKSIISGDIEYTSSLTKDEISILLDFNKG